VQTREGVISFLLPRLVSDLGSPPSDEQLTWRNHDGIGVDMADSFCLESREGLVCSVYLG
jgi:hypothetical protein